MNKARRNRGTFTLGRHEQSRPAESANETSSRERFLSTRSISRSSSAESVDEPVVETALPQDASVPELRLFFERSEPASPRASPRQETDERKRESNSEQLEVSGRKSELEKVEKMVLSLLKHQSRPASPALSCVRPNSTPRSEGCLSSRSCTSISFNLSQAKPGLIGLKNSENSGSINAVLQCVSNVPMLTDYFTNGQFREELCRQTLSGRKEPLAEAYALLLKRIWSGKDVCQPLEKFTEQLDRLTPRFNNSHHQNSHEFLVFLLDTLHEETNRVLKKPPPKVVSAVGKTEAEFADESWQDHKNRNDSVIGDAFHGLLKTTQQCLACEKTSSSVETFSCLSLPLPSRKGRLVEVCFVPLDHTRCLTKHKLSVAQTSTILDLYTALEAQVPNTSAAKMVACSVNSHKFLRIYESHEKIETSITNCDHVYIYELPTKLKDDSDHVQVKLFMKNSVTFGYFGLPLFLLVKKRDLTYGVFYNYLVRSMQRFLANADELYPFELAIYKRDDINNEKQQERALDDDMPFRLDGCQSISVVAEFSNINFFNQSPLNRIAEHPSCHPRVAQKNKALKLAECLDAFTELHELPSKSRPFCVKCRSQQRSSKKVDLLKLPQVLVLHLERFSIGRSCTNKIETLVDFPLRDLDISKYLPGEESSPSTMYNLVAVLNNHDSSSGKHSNAFAQNRQDGRWYCFDDSNVTDLNPDAVCTNAAFILFYLRQDLHSANVQPSFVPESQDTSSLVNSTLQENFELKVKLEEFEKRLEAQASANKRLELQNQKLSENKPRTSICVCTICSEELNDQVESQVLTSCGHVFCKPCLDNLVTVLEEEDQPKRCPTCRASFNDSSRLKIFINYQNTLDSS